MTLLLCISMAVLTSTGASDLSPSPDGEAAQKRVVVLNLALQGDVAPAVGSQMTARVAELIGTRPQYSVVSPDQVQALIENEANKQFAGCSEESCLAEIAGALGADILVSGSIGRMASSYAVALSAVDARQIKTLGRVSESWGGESIALMELAVPMVDKLLASKDQKLVGSLEVTGVVDGSRILIDGEVRGTAPAGQIGGILIGSRRVQVAAEGFQPLEVDAIVKLGQKTTLPLEQLEVESPFYTSLWFWGLTGAAVVAVGGGTTAAILLLGNAGSQDETGVNVAVNADTAVTGGR